MLWLLICLELGESCRTSNKTETELTNINVFVDIQIIDKLDW
jgi:hypothetical protein